MDDEFGEFEDGGEVGTLQGGSVKVDGDLLMRVLGPPVALAEPTEGPSRMDLLGGTPTSLRRYNLGSASERQWRYGEGTVLGATQAQLSRAGAVRECERVVRAWAREGPSGKAKTGSRGVFHWFSGGECEGVPMQGPSLGETLLSRADSAARALRVEREVEGRRSEPPMGPMGPMTPLAPPVGLIATPPSQVPMAPDPPRAIAAEQGSTVAGIEARRIGDRLSLIGERRAGGLARAPAGAPAEAPATLVTPVTEAGKGADNLIEL